MWLKLQNGRNFQKGWRLPFPRGTALYLNSSILFLMTTLSPSGCPYEGYFDLRQYWDKFLYQIVRTSHWKYMATKYLYLNSSILLQNDSTTTALLATKEGYSDSGTWWSDYQSFWNKVCIYNWGCSIQASNFKTFVKTCELKCKDGMETTKVRRCGNKFGPYKAIQKTLRSQAKGWIHETINNIYCTE